MEWMTNLYNYHSCPITALVSLDSLNALDPQYLIHFFQLKPKYVSHTRNIIILNLCFTHNNN